ncbi:MAG: hypothetical protein H7210_10060 [Pyrinomonadaceae bacterium]|nr:hypothetical protein [Phycisphaerales bacterium]
MKKVARRLAMLGFVVAVGAVMVTAGTSTAFPPQRPCGPRNCLDVWRPVICSNGVVYSNDCYAARACATGCVPYGGDVR